MIMFIFHFRYAAKTSIAMWKLRKFLFRLHSQSRVKISMMFSSLPPQNTWRKAQTFGFVRLNHYISTRVRKGCRSIRSYYQFGFRSSRPQDKSLTFQVNSPTFSGQLAHFSGQLAHCSGQLVVSPGPLEKLIVCVLLVVFCYLSYVF